MGRFLLHAFLEVVDALTVEFLEAAPPIGAGAFSFEGLFRLVLDGDGRVGTDSARGSFFGGAFLAARMSYLLGIFAFSERRSGATNDTSDLKTKPSAHAALSKRAHMFYGNVSLRSGFRGSAVTILQMPSVRHESKNRKHKGHGPICCADFKTRVRSKS